eukprot:scaffold130983_cov39-Phaeocystis_antarctica.AAC.1
MGVRARVRARARARVRARVTVHAKGGQPAGGGLAGPPSLLCGLARRAARAPGEGQGEGSGLGFEVRVRVRCRSSARSSVTAMRSEAARSKLSGGPG